MNMATDITMEDPPTPTATGDLPVAHSFRGHPQPPVNERLQNAKNFLADEDPNRDLNFATRISEVEEYVEQIGFTGDLYDSCDKTLLKDVRIMLKVHRQWEKRMDAPPEDTEYSQKPLIQPYSTRLISTETKMQLLEDQAAMSLTYQTREDRAPFTVDREVDHGEFIRALNEDAAMNPMLIDEDTNLLFVESRAYSKALSKPSMIPKWMHPTRGIPKLGLRGDNPPVWYRVPEPPSDAVKRRPIRGVLPQYLSELEEDINNLLSNENMTDDEYEKLEDLLQILEPSALAQLHENVNSLLYAERLGSLGARQAELETVLEQFNLAHRAWLMEFRENGVYLIPRSTLDGSEKVNVPGVFYVNDTFNTPIHNANEDRANTVLQKWLTETMLSPPETNLLQNLFALSCPTEISDLRRRRLEVLYASGANDFADVYGQLRTQCDALQVEIDRLHNAWTATIKQRPSRFIYLRPGERRSANENLLYLPWELKDLPDTQLPGRQDLQLSAPLINLRNNIRQMIRLASPAGPDMFLRDIPLAHVAHPLLRVFLIPWIHLHEKHSRGIQLKQYEDEAFRAAESIVNRLSPSWIAGLQEDVAMKLPKFPERIHMPWELYWRGTQDDLRRLGFADLAEASVRLNELRNDAKNGSTQANLDLEGFMGFLMYPQLRRIRESVLEQEVDLTRENMLQRGVRLYHKWLRSLDPYPILEIKDFNGYLDQDDDPNVIYYRQPLPRATEVSASKSTTSVNIVPQLQIHIRDNQSSLGVFPKDVIEQMSYRLSLAVDAYRYFERVTDESQVQDHRRVLEWYLNTVIENAGSLNSPIVQSQPKYNAVWDPLPLTPTEPLRSTEPQTPTESLSTPLLRQPQGVPMTPQTPSNASISQKIPSFITPLVLRPQQLPTPERIMSDLSSSPSDNGVSLAGYTYTEPPQPPEAPQVEASLTSSNRPGLTVQSQTYASLGVDLNIQVPVLDRLETEFESIVTSFKSAENGVRWGSNDWGNMEAFFQQVMPDNLLDALEFRDQAIQRRNTSPANPTTKEEQEYALIRMAASSKQTGWLKNLASAEKLQIQTSDTLIQNGSTYVVLNPRITKVGAQCRIRVPASIASSGTSSSTTGLYDPSAALRSIPRLDSQPVDHRKLLDDIRTFNTLLNKWQSGPNTMSWEESDRLLSIARAVMPRDLAKLEKDLRAIDSKARTGMLNAAEALRFWDLGDQWQTEYAAWLGLLLPDITISNESDHASIDHSNILRLRMELRAYTQLPPIVHAKGLPWLVQEAQNKVKSLLGLARQFTDNEVKEFESLLLHFWKPYASFIRRQLEPQFSQSSQRLGTNDEDANILIGTILAELFIFFQNKVRSLSPANFEIIERIPGEYRITARTSRSFWETEVRPVFFPAEMNTSREDLLKKASKLRKNELTTEQIRGIEFAQSPAAAAVRLAALVGEFESPRIIPRNIAGWNRLRAAEEAVFWNRWSRRNPGLALYFRNTSIFPLYDDFVDMLCQAFANQGRALQLNAPPNETEVAVAQIEINNLLREDQAGIISQTNLSELNYLLRALMPTNLRQLYKRANASDVELVIPSGNAQLAVVELFERYFADWKRNLPAHGVILDQWWYSTSSIQDLCSRVRRWEAMVEYDSAIGSYPATGDKITSYEAKEWYRFYKRLTTFVINGCTEDGETNNALLLQYLPANIINVPQQIRILEAPQAPAPSIYESASRANMLRTLQEHFIQKYMEWITGLESSVLAAFKNQAAARYSGKIDFTTKAERRGIQRAAIEMALNNLASNQEQHRPNDRFRIVVLPRAHQPLPQAREVPISLPLDPTKRPLEQDPMEYTKKLLAFRNWKDFDYNIARGLQIGESKKIIDLPSNFNGPFVRQSLDATRIAAQELLTRYTGLSKILHNANQLAPRPLLSRMLERLQSVLAHGRNIDRVIEDFRGDTVPLDERALGVLGLLAEPSWDEWAEEFDEHVPGLMSIERGRGKLTEFDDDVRNFPNALPFWSTGREAQYNQHEYRQDIPGARLNLIGLEDLVQSINNSRQSRYGADVHLWTQDDAYRFLGIMFLHGRIHAEGDNKANAMYAKIPLSGHPENRWIVNFGDLVQRKCYYRLNTTGQKYWVRYNHLGTVGPPILQPNLLNYLDQIFYRLGRDIVYLLNMLAHAEDDGPAFYLSHQYRLLQETVTRMSSITAKDRGTAMTAGRDPSSITLKKLALDLHNVAPDIAQEAGFDFNGDPENNMTEAQAGMILQIQILEEANNAWELKFPEKEQVWNFAEKRLKPREIEYNGKKILAKPKTQQYFSLRRFPVSHQSQTNQDFIKKTGPVIQEKPKPMPSPTLKSLATVRAEKLAAAGQQPEKMERHIKGRPPNFPFGETPYQALFQDWKMQEMLKGIPDFETPPDPPARGLFSRKRRLSPSPPPVNRYALPTIPPSWEPTSVFLADKRLSVIQDMQKLANRDLTLPAPDLLEAWHTPAEVAEIKLREQNEIRNNEIKVMVDAIETFYNDTGKKWQDLTREEVRTAQISLGIDTFTGRFLSQTPMTAGQARQSAAQAACLTGGGQGSGTAPGGSGGQRRGGRRGGRGRRPPPSGGGGSGGQGMGPPPPPTGQGPAHTGSFTVVDVPDVDSDDGDGITDVPAASDAVETRGRRRRRNNSRGAPGLMTGDPTLMSGALGAQQPTPPPTQQRPTPGMSMGPAGDTIMVGADGQALAPGTVVMGQDGSMGIEI